MNGIEKKYHELFEELLEYERYGIPIKIDGKPASPLQITTAHMIQEDSVYMRDYILNEEGHVKELCFDKIKQYK